MAKIDLAKQKKEEKENTPSTAFYSSPEELFASARAKMNLDSLIVQHKYKIENYLLAASMFEAAAQVPGALEEAAKCRELAEETRKDEIRYRYECAVRKEAFFRENAFEAKHESNWTQLRKEFADVITYADAKEHEAFCAKKEKECHNRSKRRRGSVFAVFAAIVMMGIAVWATGLNYYAVGRVYLVSEKYEKAKDNFKKCKKLLDSKALIKECNKALEAEENEESESPAQNDGN